MSQYGFKFSDVDEGRVEDEISFIDNLRKKFSLIAKKSDYEDVSACDFVEGAEQVISVLESLLSGDFDTEKDFIEALEWCERLAGNSASSELLSVSYVIDAITNTKSGVVENKRECMIKRKKFESVDSYLSDEWVTFVIGLSSQLDLSGLKLLIPSGTNVRQYAKSNNLAVCKDDAGDIHLFCNDENEQFGYCYINSADPLVKAHGWSWFDSIDELVDNI